MLARHARQPQDAAVRNRPGPSTSHRAASPLQPTNLLRQPARPLLFLPPPQLKPITALLPAAAPPHQTHKEVRHGHERAGGWVVVAWPWHSAWSAGPRRTQRPGTFTGPLASFTASKKYQPPLLQATSSLQARAGSGNNQPPTDPLPPANKVSCPPAATKYRQATRGIGRSPPRAAAGRPASLWLPSLGADAGQPGPARV